MLRLFFLKFCRNSTKGSGKPKQFTTSNFCLKCLGCCRFAEEDSVWVPHLTEEEIKDIKGMKPVPSPEGGFACPFLNTENNKCKIYKNRPLECRLYPFLINKVDDKVFLAVDTNCPYVEKEINSKRFKKHVKYLAGLLNGTDLKALLKKNPQLIHTYKDALNLAQIDI